MKHARSRDIVRFSNPTNPHILTKFDIACVKSYYHRDGELELSTLSMSICSKLVGRFDKEWPLTLCFLLEPWNYIVAIDICDLQYIDKKIVRIPPVVIQINCCKPDLSYIAAELDVLEGVLFSR